MMRVKRSLFYLLIILSSLVITLILSGNSHIFLGLTDTYLKGRSKPGLDSYTIFPHRTIHAPKKTQAFPKKNNPTVKHTPTMDQYNKKYGTLAYLVIHKDTLIHEAYFEHYDSSTISNSFSMAKSILALLTGIAQKQGEIHLDSAVQKYLPHTLANNNPQLNIRHLVQMSSGINFKEDYSNPFGFMAKAYYGKNIPKLLKPFEGEHTPGTQFMYAGGNNLLLSLALSKALNKDISTYTEEQLWQYIGAENDAQWILDHPDGNEKSFSGFFATARDFAKVGRFMLHEMKTPHLLDSAFVWQSIQAVNIPDAKGQNIDYYGYAWWLSKYKEHDVFYMRGILGQYVICIPSLDLIVVRLGKAQEKVPGNITPKDVLVYIEQAIEMIP